ncbi:MAG: hypothetical protein WED09_04755 [Homoserinimonas sp.]
MPALAPVAPSSTVREDLQARIRNMQATRLDERSLPTLPALQSLLPGGLRQGVAYSVAGSTTLAMAMLATPSAQGAWCGVLGMPDFGTEAASRLGIDLERLVLVPNPGNQWLTVAAAMTDVLDVVIARSPARVAPAETSRLGARLRQRGSTLVVLGEWPGADATLTVVGSSWQGLGAGYGYLSTRQLEVEVSGRNGMHQARRRKLTFPFDQGATSAPREISAVNRVG